MVEMTAATPGSSMSRLHQRRARCAWLTRSSEPQEFEMDEPEEPEFYAEDGVEGEQAAGDQVDDPERDGNIVHSGDPSAGANASVRNTVKELKDKKVATDKRTTTPYMTKYERARVLGTRALQIRYAKYWTGRIATSLHKCFGQNSNRIAA